LSSLINGVKTLRLACSPRPWVMW